jgi:hypothetical protein
VPVLGQGESTTWSDPVDVVHPSDADTGAFGVLVCDAYQNVHLLWSNNSDTGAALYYQNDVVGRWSIPIDVIAVDDPVLIRISAGISNEFETLHVVWQNRFIGGDVYYSRTPLQKAGDPQFWTQPLMLVAGADRVKLAVDQNGKIHIVYGISNNGSKENAVYYVTSVDEGESWSEPIPVYQTISVLPSEIQPAIAVDGRERLHIGITLRSQDYGAYSEVGYLKSADEGRNWTPYQQIQVMGTTFQGVSTITPYAFGDDEVHLTWHDPRRMHKFSLDGGETWSIPVEIMSLPAAFGGPNALAMDSAGVIHSVLGTGSGVFSVPWDGQEWLKPELIDGRFLDPHGQHIVSCQGNHLHVVYYDRLGPTRVWHSYSQVEAQPLERQILPSLQVTTVMTQSTPELVGERTVKISLTDAPRDDLSSDGDLALYPPMAKNSDRSQITPIIMAATSALVVIATGILRRVWKK